MDSGYYAAFTGLLSRGQALDVAASNLANAQTPGYRAEREFFRSVLLGPDARESQLGQAVNQYGLLGGDLLNLSKGAVQQTGNPLDLALEGQGFFAIQTRNGLRYTRDGSFHRSPKGLLVTAAGDNGNLRIEVRDSGPGFDLAAIPAGHGLDSLVERLDALFGAKARLNVLRRDGYSVVEMVLPRV